MIHLEMAKYFFNYEKNLKLALSSLDEAAKFLPTNESIL